MASEHVSSMDIMPVEGMRRYRAFLLYSMQDPGVRSLKAVHRAMDQPESTLRSWRNGRWNWRQRLEEYGPGAQTRALQLYHELFYRRYQAELRHIEHRMSIPTHPEANMPVDSDDGDQTKLAKQHAVDHDPTRRMLTRFSKIIEAGLVKAAGQLGDGSMKLRASDVPSWIRTYHEIGSLLDENAPRAGGNGVVVESVRVRMARSEGRDIMAALHEDIQELSAITSALVTRNDRATEAAAAVGAE